MYMYLNLIIIVLKLKYYVFVEEMDENKMVMNIFCIFIECFLLSLFGILIIDYECSNIEYS